MFWTLIVITMLPTATLNGTYSKYYVVSQHENRIECENAMILFAEKRPAMNKDQKTVCIKTDQFYKRLTTSFTH